MMRLLLLCLSHCCHHPQEKNLTKYILLKKVYKKRCDVLHNHQVRPANPNRTPHNVLPCCFCSSSTCVDSSVGLGIPSDVSAFSITWVSPWPGQTWHRHDSLSIRWLKNSMTHTVYNTKQQSLYSPTVATVAVAVDKMDFPQLPQYPQPPWDTVDSLDVWVSVRKKRMKTGGGGGTNEGEKRKKKSICAQKEVTFGVTPETVEQLLIQDKAYLFCWHTCCSLLKTQTWTVFNITLTGYATHDTI